jgi:hypothetical protein
MDSDTIRQLEVLSGRALEAADLFAADRSQDTERAYEQLRADAETLNLRHGWATPGDFDTRFPTLEAQELIERLDDHVGQPRDANFRTEPGAPVQRLLRHLGHWSAGVAVASRASRAFEP